ncbi:MAG: hypothetical protein ACU85V_07475 [Gammaproteobacteria bacterium]
MRLRLRSRARHMVREVHRGLAAHYWQRCGRLPPRLLLIVAAPRSGSTWLFDALRSHPQVGMTVAPSVVALLGTRIGRRYPLDLSLPAGQGTTIYMTVADKGGLPAPGGRAGANAGTSEPEVALEKVHPEYFDFRAERLAAVLERVEQDGRACVVYNVRAPAGALRSYWKYKQRNPAWSGHVPVEQVAEQMARTYASIDASHRRRPGLVVDFDELERDTAGVLEAVFVAAFTALGVDPAPSPALAAVCRDAVDLTDRDARIKAGPTPFLEQGSSGELEARLDEYLERHADLVADCERHYAALMRRSAAPAAPGAAAVSAGD